MVHIESITKEYPTKTLFSEASIHLRPSTRVGLVGRNGTGKTTLLRMIIGTDTMDDGRIRKRPWLRIGYLPQELDTPTNQTVLQATHQDEYPEYEAKRILSGLGFQEGEWERTLDTFSGGYRMRVALGHLLLSNPDVLMLDEPTNHLDKPTQGWLESFLLHSQMTMVIISHDTKFLNRMVTHIWEIRHHKIQEYRGNYHTFQ
ncbi:MAG: ATP-binding cassette domain-containing protein, partial [Nitrospirota bacterium]|nr:ATP-binding cassette domain-containing protein [Nitrospirota bacterium]